MPEISPDSENEMPRPLYTQPDAFVEHVYPLPLSLETPDTESQKTASDYLISRMQSAEPSERTQIVLMPTGKTWPSLTRDIVGTKNVRRLTTSEDWFVKPRTAVAVWVSSLALFNVVPAVGDVSDIASDIADRVESLREQDLPNDPFIHIPKGVEYETPIAIRQFIDIPNDPGTATPNAAELAVYIASVREVAKPGAEIAVEVSALSSDEYGSDASIGVREPANQDLSDEREIAWSQVVAEALPKASIETSARQDVLSKRQIRKLSRLAKQAGYDGEDFMVSAIRAAEAGDGTPTLRDFVTKNFKRGVSLSTTIQNADVALPRNPNDRGELPETYETPIDPKRDYSPFFVPLPWLRKRRWTNIGERDHKKWNIRAGVPILRPSVLHETIDQAWLRVRPEAVTDDQTLVDDAWAYTQKYEHLLRDGRIADVLRADITDDNEIETSLRIFFVDKKPEPETIDAYTKLLHSFAAMKTPDGMTIADSITGIFVLPSESTGSGSRNPKKIGLGIDQQYEEDIDGVMYYPLKLIELHMPTSLKGAELQAYLDDYRGSVWTLAHEAAGHGTDVSSKPTALKRVHSRHIANAHVFEGDPRANRADKIHNSLRPLRSSVQDDTVRQFDITYPVPDKHGTIFMMTARVDEHDTRLQHAHTSTIVGHKHTQYSGESASEQYAEIAAAATGITVDYSEANIDIGVVNQNGVTGQFATGYSPDLKAQSLYADSVGATAGTMPLSFENTPKVKIVRCLPEDDPLLRKHMIRARRTTAAKSSDLIAILTQTSRRQK